MYPLGIDEDFQPFEEFVRLHKVESIQADVVVAADKGYTPSHESGIKQLPRPML